MSRSSRPVDGLGEVSSADAEVSREPAGPGEPEGPGELGGQGDEPEVRPLRAGHTIVRYTLMRLLLFFGCLLLFYLLGLRRADQQVFLLLAAAVTSLVLSYFFLRRDRDTFSEAIADKLAARAEARRGGTRGRDEDDEDAELTP